jgi:hypothetical protein
MLNELIERQIHIIDESSKHSSDSKFLQEVLDNCSRSIKLLMRSMPIELVEKLGPEYTQARNDLYEKIKEIENIPF